jgi:thiol:disulfide interchange protein DsbD
VYGVVSATGATGTAQNPARAAAAAWQAWTPEAQAAQLGAGKPVFVDFTAAWCVTCQANKRLVLGRDAIERAMSEAGVVRMRADWTNRDEQITRELARFGRNGVPLYVLYDGRGKPQLLPELLTEGIVLDALGRL